MVGVSRSCGAAQVPPAGRVEYWIFPGCMLWLRTHTAVDVPAASITTAGSRFHPPAADTLCTPDQTPVAARVADLTCSVPMSWCHATMATPLAFTATDGTPVIVMPAAEILTGSPKVPPAGRTADWTM